MNNLVLNIINFKISTFFNFFLCIKCVLFVYDQRVVDGAFLNSHYREHNIPPNLFPTEMYSLLLVL